MRIFSTLLWGLVCLSAVVAGGFLASELAGGRSESWSATNVTASQVRAEPRTQFLAAGETKLARRPAINQTTNQASVPKLSLVRAAATSPTEEQGGAAKLTLANFNEDDRLGVVAGLAVPKIETPPTLQTRSASRATQGLNTRAPVLSLPSLQSYQQAQTTGLERSDGATNHTAPKLALAAPQSALAAPEGLDAIPKGVGLAALSSDSAPLRGLEAQGKSVSLSLFGYSQSQTNSNENAPKLKPSEPKAKARNTAMPPPEATPEKTPEEAPIPSWSEIDPNLQVASLSDSPELTPGYKSSKTKKSRTSFPRLDISVALYAMHEPLPASQKADRILVEKGARLLHLIDGDQLVKSYRIDLGFSPVGHKLAEGDGKTPEGDYRIDWRKRDSEFYRALHISYPNEQDASIAKFSGRDPGGAIMIHGRPNGFGDNDPLAPDWTAGCIAVKNAHIEELWAAVEDGAAIRIRP